MASQNYLLLSIPLHQDSHCLILFFPGVLVLCLITFLLDLLLQEGLSFTVYLCITLLVAFTFFYCRLNLQLVLPSYLGIPHSHVAFQLIGGVPTTYLFFCLPVWFPIAYLSLLCLFFSPSVIHSLVGFYSVPGRWLDLPMTCVIYPPQFNHPTLLPAYCVFPIPPPFTFLQVSSVLPCLPFCSFSWFSPSPALVPPPAHYPNLWRRGRRVERNSVSWTQLVCLCGTPYLDTGQTFYLPSSCMEEGTGVPMQVLQTLNFHADLLTGCPQGTVLWKEGGLDSCYSQHTLPCSTYLLTSLWRSYYPVPSLCLLPHARTIPLPPCHRQFKFPAPTPLASHC